MFAPHNRTPPRAAQPESTGSGTSSGPSRSTPILLLSDREPDAKLNREVTARLLSEIKDPSKLNTLIFRARASCGDMPLVDQIPALQRTLGLGVTEGQVLAMLAEGGRLAINLTKNQPWFFAAYATPEGGRLAPLQVLQGLSPFISCINQPESDYMRKPFAEKIIIGARKILEAKPAPLAVWAQTLSSLYDHTCEVKKISFSTGRNVSEAENAGKSIANAWDAALAAIAQRTEIAGKISLSTLGLILREVKDLSFKTAALTQAALKSRISLQQPCYGDEICEQLGRIMKLPFGTREGIHVNYGITGRAFKSDRGIASSDKIELRDGNLIASQRISIPRPDGSTMRSAGSILFREYTEGKNTVVLFEKMDGDAVTKATNFAALQSLLRLWREKPDAPTIKVEAALVREASQFGVTLS